ncbi:putative neogenin [Apostichopus japonicus]|uniref:Putative neogenin n=1 Tax=Stichopus japonicus TaxID=307972 RepID=A0A2G8JHA4_STIJA|nr:putative neogenin [Apostichopus japonicus]
MEIKCLPRTQRNDLARARTCNAWTTSPMPWPIGYHAPWRAKGNARTFIALILLFHFSPSLQHWSLPPTFYKVAKQSAILEIQVEWAVVPANTLSDVQYYHINYVKIGGQRERDDRVFDTSVLLFQLRPFSVYEITVTAEGNSGSYEYALATAQTFEDVIDLSMEINIPSAPPKDVTLTAVSSTAIAVTWNPPQPNRQNGIITSYSLRYREVGSVFPQIVSTIADETSIILSGLSRDTSYEVRLAAATVNGTGPYTPWRQRKTLDEEPALSAKAINLRIIQSSKLTFFRASAPCCSFIIIRQPSITFAIITWAEPSEEEEADFEGYILSYGSTSPDEFDVTIEPTETFYNLTGLTPDTEYTVYLRSFNGLTDSVPISVFFTTQSKPMDDTTYTFSLAAVNDIGESEPILASTSTLPRPIELAIPSAPSSLSLSPSVTTVLVSWEMQEMESLDLDGFILSYGVISSEENLMLIDPDRTSIEIKKLRPSTTYKFKLVSYNDIGAVASTNTIFLGCGTIDNFSNGIVDSSCSRINCCHRLQNQLR